MTITRNLYRWMAYAVCIAVMGIAGVTYQSWWPMSQQWMQSTIFNRRASPSLDEHGHAASDHAGHDHSGHGNSNSLELSAQAQGNLGLSPEFLQPIRLETFYRTMTVPAIIVERPGRTEVDVSTPMAGVITRVHAVEGEAVKPGTLLFEIRITAEELVASQTDLLKSIGDLDVENREIARLTKATESGAIPQRTLLERQYARDKLQNLLIAQKEALRLHGLSEAQVEEIMEKRRLFRDLRIVAPSPEGSGNEIQLTDAGVARASFQVPANAGGPKSSLIITNMPVRVGQTVNSGASLAELADYSELYIEGRTFERDARSLTRLAENQWKITAVFDGASAERETVSDLELVYAAAAIQVESRSLPFYVRLPNELLRSTPSPSGHTFVEWKHRPGRRVQLQVPVEEMKDQIVLPVQAVVREGAESYVFQQNGSHFDRVPVRVKHKDSQFVVIANDGSVFPGDIVARTGAHQMQMALKNKSGGGVDPHAGHNH